MTPDERTLIEDLFKRLQSADTATKDTEAQDVISRGFAAVPGAPYLLVQLALLQEHALKNAAAHIAELERGTVPQQQSTSFLGGAVASAAPVPADPWAASSRSPAPPPRGTGGGPWGQPAPSYYQPPLGNGFLGSALSTAAGVAAGSLLFNGVESLFNHPSGGYGGGWGGGMAGIPAEPRVEENVTNNYYGTSDDGAAQAADTTDAGFDPGTQDFDDSQGFDDLTSV